MNLKIRHNLWQAKKSMDPQAEFVVSLKNKLDAAWIQKYPGQVSWINSHKLQFASAMAAVVLVSGTVGTGAYAYASPNVTEGTPLYPVKQKIERIQEKLQPTPEAKAKFYLNQIRRREAEEAVMKKEGIIQAQVTKVEEKIEQTENKLENINTIAEKQSYKDEKLHQEVRARLQQRLERRKELLQGQIDQMEQRREKLNNYLENLNSNK